GQGVLVEDRQGRRQDQRSAQSHPEHQPGAAPGSLLRRDAEGREHGRSGRGRLGPERLRPRLRLGVGGGPGRLDPRGGGGGGRGGGGGGGAGGAGGAGGEGAISGGGGAGGAGAAGAAWAWAPAGWRLTSNGVPPSAM